MKQRAITLNPKWAVLLLTVAATLMVACKHDEIMPVPRPAIDAILADGGTEVTVPNIGAELEIKVTSNIEWSAAVIYEGAPAPDTLALLSATQGENNGAVVLSFCENSTAFDRVFEVVFTGGEIRQNGEVVQCTTSKITVTQQTPETFFFSANGGWAGSNIYWDGSKLTFADCNTFDKQYYQGVFFKFGSLVGASPSAGDWSTDLAVYAPTEWSGKDNVKTSGYDWGDIPFIAEYSTNLGNDHHYVLEFHDPASGRGDICKYITDKGWAPGADSNPRVKWRMPTCIEFEGDYVSHGEIVQPLSFSDDGTSTISSYYTEKKSDTRSAPAATLPSFPAAGYRHSFLYSANKLGRIRSATAPARGRPQPGESASSYFLTFTRGGDGTDIIVPIAKMYSATVGSTGYRQEGMSVRCVRDESTPMVSEPPTIKAKLAGSGVEIIVTEEDRDIEIEVISDVEWTASLTLDGVPVADPAEMLSQVQGANNGTVIFATGRNNSVSLRVFEIVFTGGGLTSNKIIVNQKHRELHYSMHGGWAGSNIYWDGAKLTFADSNTTDKELYQGLFFKYGSLVGLSTKEGKWDSSYTVYAPTEWSGKNVIETDGYEWTDIPWETTWPYDLSGDRQYLLEVHNPKNGTGDICKYITDKGWAPGADSNPRVRWRMPTFAEFGAPDEVDENYTEFVYSPDDIDITTDDYTGMYNLPYYVKRTKDSNNPSSTKPTRFPYSGYRDNYYMYMLGDKLGILNDCGDGAMIWSATPDVTLTAGSASLCAGYVWLGGIGRGDRPYPDRYGDPFYRMHGMSVRCVRDN